MKRKFKGGLTSVSLPIFVADTSSTTGGGLSGVTHASSGLVLEYRRQGQSTWTTVTAVSKTLGTYVSGGIVADGSLAGAYEVDFPDAAFASGARMVLCRIRGVTNMLAVLIEIELDAVDYQDADAFGLSRLNDTITSRMASYTQPSGFLAATFPGTVASPTNITSATGIVLAGVTHTGAVIPLVTDVTTKTGYTAAVSDKSGFSLAPTTGLGNQTANITGNLSGSVGSVTGAVGSISGVSFPTNFGSMVINSTTGHTAAVVHSVQAGAYTSAAFAANWLTAAGLAADAVAEIADGVWDEATSGHATAGTTGKALIDSGAAGNPWSTDLATGYSGTQAGNILNSVKSQADLIQAGGTVNVSTPVTATGQLASPLIIGDDYLAANGRRFRWTVALPSGYVIATSTARFGMRYEDDEGVNEFIATGTVTDATGGNVYLDFDVAKTVTGTLRPGWYEWSVEIVSATGVEITRVKSGKNAEWQGKQT